jgi:hypothetical protein
MSKMCFRNQKSMTSRGGSPIDGVQILQPLKKYFFPLLTFYY